MKILQLCKKFPYPIKDGESIAVNSLSKALSQLGAEISLLAMNTEKHYAPIPLVCPELSHYKKVDSVYVDNSIKPLDALTNLINGKSYHISRFDSDAYKAKLIELLTFHDFDIVQLETSFMSLYIKTIREHSNAKIVLRSHNHEYQIWERVSENSSYSRIKNWYLKNCAERLFNFEKKRLNQYDLVASITESDQVKYMELDSNVNAIASPTGLDLSMYHRKPLKEANSLGFIGSLDWMPNVEGLKWFLLNVWPQIHSNHKDLKFHIAGRNIGPELTSIAGPNVIIEGEVKCSKNFISAHNMMIVPLFAGSGLRIKILEGLALGRTIISTKVGAEGLKVKNGEHLLLADTEKQFTEAIDYCMEQPDVMKDLHKSGRNLVEDHYDNIKNAEKLLHNYKGLLKDYAQIIKKLIIK